MATAADKKAEAEAKALEESAKSEEVKTIKVTVKRNGFRRAGRAWSGETIIKQDELTEAQIEALETDPMFVVER